MEAANLRVRDSTRDTRPRLLLPVSGGLSSLALLHILDGHVSDQVKRTGRPGFELVVLAVDDGTHEENELNDFIENLKARYTGHKFVLIALPAPTPNSPDLANTDNGAPLNMSNILATLKAPTSHSDIASLALTHTITQQAQQLHCDFILWGDSTTRLAEKILASTALGRGATLPSLVNDGPAPYSIAGGSSDSTSTSASTSTSFLYPMKDVFRKELLSYATIISLPPLLPSSNARSNSKATSAAVVSSKNATIDSLMHEYFASVEKDYPSIVANVVRTSSKLQMPSRHSKSDSADVGSRCELCGVWVEEGSFGIHGWGGSQGAGKDGDGEEVGGATPPVPTDPMSGRGRRLCYGCARSTLSV